VALQSDPLNILRDAILNDATRFAGANIGTILSEIQNVTYGLSALNTDLDTLITRLGDPTPSTIKGLIDAIESKLDNGTYGLSALQALLIAIQGTGFVKDTHSLVNIVGYVDEVESLLKNASYGLSALKTLIDAVEGKLDNATYGLNALKTLINNIEAKLDNATYGLAALNTDLDTILTRVPSEVAQKSHLVHGTGNITPPTNKGIWDYLPNLDAAVSSRATPAQVLTQVQTEIGAFSGQTNLKTLLAALGIPDVAGKPLYTCLVTDRWDTRLSATRAGYLDNLANLVTHIIDGFTDADDLHTHIEALKTAYGG